MEEWTEGVMKRKVGRTRPRSEQEKEKYGKETEKWSVEECYIENWIVDNNAKELRTPLSCWGGGEATSAAELERNIRYMVNSSSPTA